MATMWGGTSLDFLKRKAYEICQEFLEGPWQKITIEEFDFDVVKGGLSNKLYRCALSEKGNDGLNKNNVDHPKEVLLRIYGPVQEGSDIVIQETAIFMMFAENNLGPKLFGIFPNGRLEQYIPSRSLLPCDMYTYRREIATEMAKIHSVHVPVPKKPTTLFMHQESWLNFLEENVDDLECSDVIRLAIQRKETRREVNWLKEKMSRLRSPIVFCHNDLHGGNVLLTKNTTHPKKLLFIDFEFGSYNYRGFDIANFMCECCFRYHTNEPPFFEVDFNKLYSKDEQMDFIAAYLKELNEHGHHCHIEEEKLKIFEEIKVFFLHALLLWSIWSYRTAISSTITFGYWEHGLVRWEAYKEFKSELLQREFHQAPKMNG